MKKIKTICSVLFAVFTLSCSSDDDQSPELSVITTFPVEVMGRDARFKLDVSTVGDGLEMVGIVYSEEPNPVVGNESVDMSIGGSTLNEGEIDFGYKTLKSNTTYYARAFADQGNLGIQYGNEVTFTIGTTITTGKVTNISTIAAYLHGSVVPGANTTNAWFAYGTEPNPTVAGPNFSNPFSGTEFVTQLYHLEPNTHYYYRAYSNGEYGEQREFTTAGYEGQAGGYVVYDKGEVTDGWRYLEMHPTGLQFEGGNTGAQWGDSYIFISGTSEEIGTGTANTELIANNTIQANCAAKLCRDLVLNGYSDWFLGSHHEISVGAYSMKDIGYSLEPMWTSSDVAMWNQDDFDGNSAYMVYYSGPLNVSGGWIWDFNYEGMYKETHLQVYPMRRF